MIAFACETCAQNYSVSDDKVGRQTLCAKCGSKLTVPSRVDEGEELDKAAPAAPILEDAPSTTGTATHTGRDGPACPTCGSGDLGFKAIAASDTGTKERDELLARAAEDFRRRLWNVRQEANRKLAAIAERSREVPPEEAKWLPADHGETQAEEVRAWLKAQEQAARVEFYKSRRAVREAYPSAAETRLSVVYCYGCGHIISAVATATMSDSEPSADRGARASLPTGSRWPTGRPHGRSHCRAFALCLP